MTPNNLVLISLSSLSCFFNLQTDNQRRERVELSALMHDRGNCSDIPLLQGGYDLTKSRTTEANSSWCEVNS